MGNEGPPGEDGNNALIVSTSYDILEPGKLPFLKQEFPSTSTTNLHFGLPAGTPGKDGKSLYDIWVERTPELEQHDYDIFFAEFKGSDGERGAEGPMGPHTNIRVGTTEYSTEAQPAAITERPDLENDVIYLDFVMPTGKEGPMGPPGPRGLTGSLGEDLSDVPQNAKLHMRM
jgi:hypothetical protein